MPDLRHVVREILSDHPQADEEQVAEAAYNALTALPPSEQYEALKPLLVGDIRTVVRRRVHNLERLSQGEKIHGSDSTTTIGPIQAREALLESAVYVPEVGYVNWRAMTPAMHEARAAYLLTQAAGITATARLHQTAAVVLRQAGAVTLEAEPALINAVFDQAEAA
jgi:hypothetical protein